MFACPVFPGTGISLQQLRPSHLPAAHVLNHWHETELCLVEPTFLQLAVKLVLLQDLQHCFDVLRMLFCYFAE